MENNMISITVEQYKELLKAQMQVEQIKYGLTAFKYDSDKVNYIKVTVGLAGEETLS